MENIKLITKLNRNLDESYAVKTVNSLKPGDDIRERFDSRARVFRDDEGIQWLFHDDSSIIKSFGQEKILVRDHDNDDGFEVTLSTLVSKTAKSGSKSTDSFMKTGNN